jgi:ankyrin repeat protein
MQHIFKFILSDYIDDNDKMTLLSGITIKDFYLPLNILNINIQYQENYALRNAINHGNLPVIKFLVEKGANIHIWFDFPLKIAVKSNRLDIVEFLVEKGADIHTSSDLALILSCRSGYVDILKFLVSRSMIEELKTSINIGITYACMYGKLDVIKYLVEAGADIHVKNDRALRYAKQAGNRHIIDYILSLGDK